MLHALCAMRFFSVAQRYALCAMLILVAFVLPAGEAEAQGILQGVSGYFEFVFNTSSTKFTDSSGNTVKLDSMIYTERLRLNVDTQIFPTLQLRLAGSSRETCLKRKWMV